MKETMLNKSFAGGYGSVSEDEHTHEIMDLLQTDDRDYNKIIIFSYLFFSNRNKVYICIVNQKDMQTHLSD